MQRKLGLDRDRKDAGGFEVIEVPYVVQQAPVWRSVPFIMLVMMVVLGAIYCGRGEVWNAYVGARAYISQAVLSRTQAVLRLEGPPQGSAAASAAAATAPLVITKQIVKIPESQHYTQKEVEVWDEPIPATCNAQQHTDYDGYAVQWGIAHFARSAAECCRLCQDFKPGPGIPHPCNTWVWCGDPSGTCWTPDIHTHHTGSCWLKYQEKPKLNHQGQFPAEFRAEHKTAPLMVPQTSGLISKGSS